MKHRFAPTFLALGLSTVFLGAGCRQILDIPEPVECGSDDACTTADSPCIAGECVDGFCAYSFKAAGTVIDEAAEDDCKSNVCDGNGELTVAIVPEDAPADATPGDCQAPACDAEGNVVSGPAADPPADMTFGDCSAPACDSNGGVTTGPKDDDLPTTGDAPGDCVRPTCSNGAIVDEPNDMDAPEDALAGDCSSPSCDSGMVVQVPNEEDAPAEDIDGDCHAPVCDMGGMQAIDDTDVPTSGCGSCDNGVVVPWAEVGMACYTGDAGTINVGACHGGTWACDENNVKICSGEQIPVSETCTGGGSGVDDDCDMSTDEEGTGCACQLGQTQPCYTGPGGTQNVGICDDGISTCQMTPNGNQYGSCVGEVLPQACDSCLVSGDQDCSGSSATCTGTHVWSKAIGGADFDYAHDIAVLPNGEILICGSFGGSLTAGNTVTADGSWDGALVRLDADGNAINVREYGGTGSDSVNGITLLNDGYVIFGTLGDGSSETFGSGATLTGVGNDGFVAKFNSSHTLQWKKLIGGTMNDSISAVVRMPDNGIAVTGQFTGTLNVGGTNLVSSGFQDIFVARFDATGAHVWSKKFGNNQQNNVYDMEVAPNGDLVIVGDLGSNITFGSTTITAAGGLDGYVVRMNELGDVLWARGWLSAGDEQAMAVGILSDGSVWAGGDFDTAVNLNGVAGAEISPTSSGEDLLMVKYDASGNYITAKAWNGTSQIYMRDIDIGFDDGVLISGGYDGTLFFAALATPAVGNVDAFLLKIGPTGNQAWGKKWGGTSGDDVDAVDVGPCGDLFIVGDFFGTGTSYGGGALPNEGFNDYVVGKYRQ